MSNLVNNQKQRPFTKSQTSSSVNPFPTSTSPSVIDDSFKTGDLLGYPELLTSPTTPVTSPPPQIENPSKPSPSSSSSSGIKHGKENFHPHAFNVIMLPEGSFQQQSSSNYYRNEIREYHEWKSPKSPLLEYDEQKGGFLIPPPKNKCLAAITGDESSPDDSPPSSSAERRPTLTEEENPYQRFQDLTMSSSGKDYEIDEITSIPERLKPGQEMIEGTNIDLIDGEIMGRLDTRSLMNKKWQKLYYVINKGILYLYDNKDEYENSKCRKQILLLSSMRAMPIKPKDYNNYGTLFNFMLVDIRDYGTIDLGKFGSDIRYHIDLFWNRIKDMILYLRYQRGIQQRQALSQFPK